MAMLDTVILKSVVAGLLASLACGLGALPLAIPRFDARKKAGIGFGIAAGLMFAASVYNLILPALTLKSNAMSLGQVIPVLGGILLGSIFLWSTDRYLSTERLERAAWMKWGTRKELLIFLAMAVHSIPEGVAVGVGYASEPVYHTQLGSYIAIAIAIHNIPEGLAVALPMRSAGASITKCFIAAFLTSLPQPLAAVPASYVSWVFQPLMPVLMGFAAGAMIFLVVLEMLPEALEEERPATIAWSFMGGFCAMLLVQVML